MKSPHSELKVVWHKILKGFVRYNMSPTTVGGVSTFSYPQKHSWKLLYNRYWFYILGDQSLTDGLCCACSCSSHSHHIFGSHWHTVIAWRRIWGWLKGVATPPSCAPGNVHILSRHNRPSLETDLVLCDVSSYAWTCLTWTYWFLERDIPNSQLIHSKRNTHIHSSGKMSLGVHFSKI